MRILSVDESIDRTRNLLRAGRRVILGIAGAPGAGKSTLAQRVVDALGGQAAYVPMDGFHLANVELARLDRGDRKGAMDTFDAHGYVALLQRLRAAESVVYAPRFAREIEEPIAGAIPVAPEIELVVTEGNYLLVGQGAWGGVRPLLDDAWYVEMDEAQRIELLIARHASFGKTPEAARQWALGSDQRNAELIQTTRHRADVIVRIDHRPG